MSPGARGLDSNVNWDNESQRKFWNAWDIQHLQTTSEETLRRGNEALTIVSSLNLQQPRILEIGCGTGWLAERLLKFGPVTGVDIADAAIQEARRRVPSGQFHSGDILEMRLPHNSFDFVVTLETFSHVSSQPQFIAVIANLLSEGGYLILTTQNRNIYMRNSRVAPPPEGPTAALGDDARVTRAVVGSLRMPALLYCRTRRQSRRVATGELAEGDLFFFADFLERARHPCQGTARIRTNAGGAGSQAALRRTNDLVQI